MGDNVISLTSSDDEKEETKEPPKKRIKPTLIQSKHVEESFLLISSDEEEELPHLPEITIIKPKKKSSPSRKDSNDDDIIENADSIKNGLNGDKYLNNHKENLCDDIEIVSTTSEEEPEIEDDIDEEDIDEIDVKIEELYDGYDDTCEIIDETDDENVNNSVLDTVSDNAEMCMPKTQKNGVVNLDTVVSMLQTGEISENIEVSVLETEQIKNEVTEVANIEIEGTKNKVTEVPTIENDDPEVSVLATQEINIEDREARILKTLETKNEDVIILDTDEVSEKSVSNLKEQSTSKDTNTMLKNASKKVCNSTLVCMSKNLENHNSEKTGKNKVLHLDTAQIKKDSENCNFEKEKINRSNSEAGTLSEHYMSEKMVTNNIHKSKARSTSTDSDSAMLEKSEKINSHNSEAKRRSDECENSIPQKKKKHTLHKLEACGKNEDIADSISQNRNENCDLESQDISEDSENSVVEKRTKIKASHLKIKETSEDTEDSFPEKKEKHKPSHSKSHKTSEDTDDSIPHKRKPNKASSSKVFETSDDSDDSRTERKKSDEKEIDKKEPEDIAPFSDDTCKAKECLQKFFDACSESVKDTKYEPLKSKYKNLQNLLLKYIKSNGMNDEIKKLIKDNTAKAQCSPSDAVVGFNALYEYMKDSVDNPIEVQPEHRDKVRKLLKTMLKLLKKIKKLEESEVDFDADADSAYLQEDRYKRRLAQVYEYYCKLLKMNPRSGRITFKKLDFSSSNYNEINQAINKKIKNNTKFPTYGEIEKIVRKCVKERKLHFSEHKIKLESEKCFKAVGELLQTRRKHELYESHYNFIREETDPATHDSSLERRLKKSFVEGLKKIDELCQRYTEKQYSHKDDTPLSEDSDDSHYKASDSDSDPDDK